MGIFDLETSAEATATYSTSSEPVAPDSLPTLSCAPISYIPYTATGDSDHSDELTQFILGLDWEEMPDQELWQIGDWSVEIYIGEALIQTLTFTVQD